MVSLLKGDCLKVMATLPDRSVDCFICDLPYGQLHAGRKEADKGKWWDRPVNGCGWDVKIDLVEFWKQVKRLCKDDHTPVLMFCNTKFGYDLIKSNEAWFRYDLVWDKGVGVSFLC
jgi:site-specific DNA-methyltransferase (adenine-specific)